MRYRLALSCVYSERFGDWSIVGYRYWPEPCRWWELLQYRQETCKKHGDNSGIFSMRIRLKEDNSYDATVLSLYWPDFTIVDLSETLHAVVERIRQEVPNPYAHLES